MQTKISFLFTVAIVVVVLGCGSEATKSPTTKPNGDGDAELEQEAEYPDNNFVYEVRNHPDDPPATDEPFLSEETVYYRTADKLPDTEVKCLQRIDTTVYVGTSSGLLRYNTSDDSFVYVQTAQNLPVIDISANTDANNCLYIAHERSVERICNTDQPALFNASDLDLDDDENITAVDALAECNKFVIGTNQGVYLCDVNSECDTVEDNLQTNDLAVLTSPNCQNSDDFSGKMLVATQAGLTLIENKNSSVLDNSGAFTAVAKCNNGGFVAGGTEYLLYQPSNGEPQHFTAEHGKLPETDFTALDCRGDWILMGHKIGATAIKTDFSHKDHYVSKRWVVDNTIVGVALDENGARWLASPAGITHINLVERTLKEKAEIMQQMLDEYFWRMDGFVSPEVYTQTEWSMDGVQKWDSDNDGLWTQMMIGAFCFAYAVTGDEFYCQEARKAIKVMMLQIDIPCESFKEIGRECGFVARSLVRDDEGEVFNDKANRDNWHRVEYQGHTYYWKDDTSSDETTGHFFGYPLYYDLCATEEEKVEIAKHVEMLANHIVDNGFYLIDLDGEKTTWGHWAPEWIGICVNGISDCMANAPDPGLCFSACYGGGWLNSLEILGHLLAAWHITGNKKFYDAYNMLITEYHYDKIAEFNDNVYTCTRRNIQNHSDHELAILAYHTLIRYEPNEERRQKWIESLLGFYETELPERNPLWAAFVAGLAGEGYDKEGALRTMRELPLDRRYWLVDNEHRKDYIIDSKKGRHGELQFTEVVPYDELGAMWWNGNPYAVKRGGNGKEVKGPMAYLLPYWALRYYGLLGTPQK